MDSNDEDGDHLKTRKKTKVKDEPKTSRTKNDIFSDEEEERDDDDEDDDKIKRVRNTRSRVKTKLKSDSEDSVISINDCLLHQSNPIYLFFI